MLVSATYLAVSSYIRSHLTFWKITVTIFQVKWKKFLNLQRWVRRVLEVPENSKLYLSIKAYGKEISLRDLRMSRFGPVEGWKLSREYLHRTRPQLPAASDEAMFAIFHHSHSVQVSIPKNMFKTSLSYLLYLVLPALIFLFLPMSLCLCLFAPSMSRGHAVFL